MKSTLARNTGTPSSCGLLGSAPTKRKKKRTSESCYPGYRSGQQKCSEQPRQRRVIRTPACQACTHAPAPERSKALVPSSPCTAAKMFLSGVRWHTQTSPWQKLNQATHTRQHPWQQKSFGVPGNSSQW